MGPAVRFVIVVVPVFALVVVCLVKSFFLPQDSSGSMEKLDILKA